MKFSNKQRKTKCKVCGLETIELLKGLCTYCWEAKSYKLEPKRNLEKATNII